MTFTLLARALVAAARDEPAGVVEALRPLTETGDHRMITANARHFDVLTANAARPPAREASIAGIRARLHARTGRVEEDAAEFARATELLGPEDPFLEQAILHYDLGAFLLARGDRGGGAARLLRAREMLAGVGAVPYLERLDARLAEAGVRPTAPSGGSGIALTDAKPTWSPWCPRG